jgi:fibronectin type 3 domain-containing protein
MNLGATVISQTRVDLNWKDTSTNETGFLIERSTAGGAFAALATAAANAISFSDTTGIAATSYAYRVSAVNSSGASAPTAAVSVTTFPNPPAAPSGLAAVVVSATQVNLSWVDNSSNETSFSVERATGTGAFSVVASVAANSVSYVNTTTAGGITYSYRIRAVNSGGNSAYSATVTATTPAAPPSAPTTLTASVLSQTQVKLSWKDTSANETGFLVERAVGNGAFAALATAAANTTTFTDSTAVASTTYYYRVSAVNGTGTSAPTAAVVATTLPPVPNSPTGLAAIAVSSTQVNLTWVDNATNETSYSVERATGAGAFAVIASLAANATTYQDATVLGGTTYSYRIRAANTGGNSAYTATATTATPSSGTAPAAPSALSAVANTANQVTLTWVDNSSTEAGFTVEFLSGSTWISLSTLAANVTTCTVSGLTTKTTYSFRISAYNSAGSSAPVTTNVTTP